MWFVKNRQYRTNLILILNLMDEKAVAAERHRMCWQGESQAGPWHLRKVLRD
jgi:hypothetical protein